MSKIIAISLIIVGVAGLGLSSMMLGDIGVAAGIGSIMSILAGVGFLINNKSNSNASSND